MYRNESLKNKIRSYDENGLEDLKPKLLKQSDDEKRENLIMARMEKQIKKTKLNGLYRF